MVAALCEKLGVPHEILTVEWDEEARRPQSRNGRGPSRYAALAELGESASRSALSPPHIMPRTRRKRC